MNDAFHLSPNPLTRLTAEGDAMLPVGNAVELTFRKERKRLLAFIRKRVPEPDDA